MPTPFPRILARALLFFGALTFAAAVASAAFKPEPLAAIDAAVAAAIADHKTPGAVVWVQHGADVYERVYGNRALVPSVEPATADTIYDAASLTKVIATTTAVMQLVESGRLELEAPVARYWPEFAANGKDVITVHQLLTHTSGLRPDLSLKEPWTGTATALALVAQEKLAHPPGTLFVYSDINFIVLGELVHRVSGRPLDVYTAEAVFRPLKMVDTGFRPPAGKRSRIAPTELTDGVMLRGVVHDPTARRMDGVAGHAGLFTTAADLARFARMLLGGGELDGVRILQPETVAAMTRPQTDGTAPRGFGWDIDSPYASARGAWFPAGRSYGHTGWTGTSLWIDPTSQSFVIVLANRVHPDGKGDVVPLRRAIATHAAEAIGLDTTAVVNGIDVLEREGFAPLRGLRVGLITNQSGRSRSGRSTIDLLHEAPGVRLVALFSPEHGIRGEADAAVDGENDRRTGLPIHSLYGAPPKRLPDQSQADYDLAVLRARAPRPEQLRDVDALVFDIQDVGARFYTYSSTLGLALEAAARAKKKFFVLDRINPIGGVQVEGPVMTVPPSFIGFHPLPVRHGLTFGELARLYNAERELGADLAVIACEHWTRDEYFDDTGLPWTNPSPAMRTVTAAVLYPGLCLLERTALSMGRGTLHPFEQVGAPFVDGERLRQTLAAFALPGVRFEAVTFTPSMAFYSGPENALKFREQSCGGVRVRVTDRQTARPVDVGLALALALQRLYSREFSAAPMLPMLGDQPTLAAIQNGASLDAIHAAYAQPLEAFASRRKQYLLYAER